ncbi:MAG: sensor hybrid histidine kinase [Acidimicrobiia bacterium]|nr:sensor hybrid histidine kinase [Acidimicrobiia bacterium]
MVCIGDDGLILLANSRAEQLFGYPRGGLVGWPGDVVLPTAVDAARRRARVTNAGVELQGRRRDGQFFPAEVSVSSVSVGDGALVSLTVRDLSRQVLEADARKQLASIVESSHDAIVGKSVDGRIVSWNPAATRLYGYRADEALGRTLDLIVPPQTMDHELDLLARIVKGEHVELQETVRRTKSGAIVEVLLSMSPIHDDRGMIVGAATLARDVSRLKRVERMFGSLLEAAPDAMVCVDRHGRIELANAQAEALFGHARAEMVGKPIQLLVPAGSDLPNHGHLELPARRRDGTEFPAEITLSSIETDQGWWVSAAIRDATERLQAEADRELLRARTERDQLAHQLEQSQRLESLGQLAGGVAHDFNNLLAVILNYSAFTAEELATFGDAEGGRFERLRADVEQVQRAAEHAAKLTRQLLAFARRDVVRPQVMRVNDVVQEVRELLHRTIGADVELDASLAPDLWLTSVDPTQLKQVILNLAVNARDAMPLGGTLALDTTNVRLGAPDALRDETLPEGRYVRLRVSDTGLGMTPEILERVFEPFFTTKPPGEGTGLGLATVYGIVAQAGGRVDVFSEPGFGTTVSMLLPAVPEGVPTVSAPVSRPAPRRGAGETILVVEDEPAMRSVALRILLRNGYQVLAAPSGPEAIEVVSRFAGPIDLLLTDVVMPRMQGKELSARLLALRPSMAVLFMSGYAHPVLAVQGTLETGVTLVEKPFTENMLLQAVADVLDARSA